MINKIKPAPTAWSEVAVSIHSDFETLLLYYKSLWSSSCQRELDALKSTAWYWTTRPWGKTSAWCYPIAKTASGYSIRRDRVSHDDTYDSYYVPRPKTNQHAMRSRMIDWRTKVRPKHLAIKSRMNDWRTKVRPNNKESHERLAYNSATKTLPQKSNHIAYR